ncbi:MAG: tRNA (N(6)-L-threonylcarbamoyladenosine(37)-C(2))-methylthiotransferase MtaB, partial [Deltaproteobacteria bacterium]|nr:tRNA (N(6)-L-threonylcarbamoyladenosine(37)-C(2))-methylthiotransferase MtaB [Deltaproteobacteria bacterium]
MRKAYISTLGCKVNQYESASFETGFEEKGLAITHDVGDADLIVINTCAVTSKASAQSRQEIRKAARLNQRAEIVITGCHAHLLKDDLQTLTGIDANRIVVVANDRKDSLVANLIEKPASVSGFASNQISRSQDVCHLPVKKFGNRTRAYLRVQDGCDSYCSYCIVPYARGHSRSLHKAAVLRQAKTYAEAGHREIVITGIHVGNYGNDLDETTDIATLIETLCRETPSVRYRLSSIEPLEISEKLLTLMQELGNFMPHLHIPLQSGDDEILARMNRRYTSKQFISVLRTCSAMVPDAAIGIDVMVGFPGESQKHYSNTRNLLEQINCTYLHVFPYSKRPGTQAAEMKNQVNGQEKQQRVLELRSLGKQKQSLFCRSHIGTRREVLVEKERTKSGQLKGFTDNYIPVRLDGEDRLMNSIITARLQQFINGAVKAHT